MTRERRHTHVWWTCLALCLAAVGVLLFESAGGRTRLTWDPRGDLGREMRGLGQYGQLGCVAICLTMVWLIDVPRRRKIIAAVVVALLITAGATTAAKRLAGRVRPTYDGAGEFLGPKAGSDASRESFPSGHTSSAVAMTVVLAAFYPRVRGLLWVLAALCGALRWLREAHWLSDVLAGAALGYVVAHLTLIALERVAGRATPAQPGVPDQRTIHDRQTVAGAAG